MRHHSAPLPPQGMMGMHGGGGGHEMGGASMPGYGPGPVPPSLGELQPGMYPHEHFHHSQMTGLQPHQRQQLIAFWSEQMEEIKKGPDFKNHQLPLARIKKIMKSDEDVRMIGAEAPVLFAKACEMFILELTLRSWIHASDRKRRTLQGNDIAAAITKTDIFDFLVDIVPREDPRNNNNNSKLLDGDDSNIADVQGEGAMYQGSYYERNF